jgi:2-polyprenyl-3-methyl-5-hydroxy-6-metoxy-1,4-benzoquinol methylase
MYAPLGDVQSILILNTACGQGNTSKWFSKQGTIVSAFDACPTMVQLTKEKLGDTEVIRRLISTWI